MSEHKTKAESLVYAPENGHSRVDAVEEERCVQYCEGYKQFLDEGKTERECVRERWLWRRELDSVPWCAVKNSPAATKCTV